MNVENVERKNIFGNAKYNAVFQELKAEVIKNSAHNFIWE